jgi:glycosyltransferase involved in cell wall biosynthesis
MKVFIDGTPFLIEKTGIGHYTENLLLALGRIDPGLQLGLFTISLRRGHRLPRLVPAVAGMEVRGFNLPANFLYYTWWRHFSSPAAERLVGEFDIFHAVNYQAPPCKRARLVSTIHDVNFLRFPEMQSKGIRRFSLTLEELIGRSAVVLTDSEFTSRELEELELAAADKLRVVYPGLHPVFYQTMDPERAQDIRDLFGLESPYLAYVGNLHPRKNLATLIEAFGILRRRGLPHRLAIIGGGGLGQLNNQEYRKLERRVNEMGLEEAITFTGYVADENLPALFAGAEAFIFPSLYEGFGLSPLEAMACGVPVVTSRRSSIPEVVGEAAVYLDEPRDAREIADKTEALLSDPALREELVDKGRTRVSLFTWEEAARRVLQIYQEVAG